MKRLLIVGIVALIAAAWTGTSTRAQPSSAGESAPAAATKSRHTSPRLTADEAFEVKGTLKKRTPGAVTITRAHLPAAVLAVRPETEVWVDGKKAAVKQLEDGAEVRALFQLDGQKIVAVRIEASSPSLKERGTGGSGLDEELKSDLDRMADPAKNNEPDPAADAAEREAKEPTQGADEAW